MLLDDLLVAEDLAAAETTSAASHAAAAAAASNLQQGRLQGRYGFNDDRPRVALTDSAADGAVVVGSPVAPPVNGDIYTDISTENAMLPGSRYISFTFNHDLPLTCLLFWLPQVLGLSIILHTDN